VDRNRLRTGPVDVTRLESFKGVTVDMDGPFRVELLDNWWYVVGGGMMIPCRNRAEAEAAAEEFTHGL
jgi:hypothetical protein